MFYIYTHTYFLGTLYSPLKACEKLKNHFIVITYRIALTFFNISFGIQKSEINNGYEIFS